MAISLFQDEPQNNQLGLTPGGDIKRNQVTIIDELLRQKELDKRLDELYKTLSAFGRERLAQDHQKLRGQAIDEEAALGRLTSPASIPSIANIDTGHLNALANFDANLAGQRANQEVDVLKILEGLKTNREALAENKRQFDISGLLEKEKLKENTRLGELGIIEAGNRNRLLKDSLQPGILDFINTGLGVAKLFK